MSMAYVPAGRRAVCQVCQAAMGNLFVIEGINGYVALCRSDEGLTDREVRERIYGQRGPKT